MPLYDDLNGGHYILLGYFVEEESLEGQGRRRSRGGGGGAMQKPRTDGASEYIRTIKLESAPFVLILHLKQFYFDSVYGPRKRGLRIKYEDELEVGGYICWGCCCMH